MITLKMEKHSDGTQKPIGLKINNETYIYSFDSELHPNEEFFKRLKGFENYKIKVEYYDIDGNFLKETNHIIKDIRRNAMGVMALELD